MIYRCALALVLAALLLNAAAHAVPIRMEAGRFAAAAVDAIDGDRVDMSAKDFHLLGADGAGDYLLFSDGRFLKVSADAVEGVLRALGSAADDLPSVEDYPEIGRGAGAAVVTALQEALIAQGYLEGKADGSFGGKSRDAVAAFRADHGLEPTGTTDALTQMLVFSEGQDMVYVMPETDPARAYGAIIDRIDADLSRALELGLTLQYDDISGEGALSNGTVIAYSAPAASDIDKCDFSIRLVLMVRPGEDGAPTVRPAMEIQCLCVRRPVMERVLLKSGDSRCTLEVAELTSALSGVDSLESGVLWLDDAALDLLSGAVGAGELKLRIQCRYDSYDIVVPRNLLGGVSNVALAAQAL